MAVALSEPISPELVLVCPELRERAIAALSDLAWQTLLLDVRTRRAPAHVEARSWRATAEAVVGLAATFVPALTLMLCTALVTTALTVIADAIR